ncbi:hypothetical protein HOLleu_03193 [Holothuria leucospilota]|uniref:Uncharacterized protein n=1 Tax=Holothuria leucospilota TaxID=206669 RepID=A0A9Q1CQH6_HOLLE|nr:hypothetical protein HOLleu_03193 [Holothuria leucospilota]
MRQQKYIKVEEVPKTEDVEEFASFRYREIEKAVKQLEDCFTLPVYRRCQNKVLAQLASFNKRRPGEVEQLRRCQNLVLAQLASFNKRRPGEVEQLSVMRQQKYIKVEELPKTEDVEEFASFRNREIEKAVKQLEDCFTLPVVMRQQKYIKVEELPKTEDVEEFASFRNREIEKAVKQLEDCFTLPVQFMPLPRAICDSNGIPNKGNKAVAATFLQQRYPDAFGEKPYNLVKDSVCVIMEGMFMINFTRPRS